MTEPTKNEPAFPIIHPPVEGVTCGGVEYYGLSLRDYFAAKAMQAHTVGRGDFADSNKRTIAECAYDMADAMLEVRK